MVEISNNKKNIIILFILMSIILLFIYKGFIADSNHYLEQYKNYLITINASQYYFEQIDKNKNNKVKKEKIENEKIKDLLLKLKNALNNSININAKLIKNLSDIDFTKIRKFKNVIKDTVKHLNQSNKNDYDLLKIIDNYTTT